MKTIAWRSAKASGEPEIKQPKVLTFQVIVLLPDQVIIHFLKMSFQLVQQL